MGRQSRQRAVRIQLVDKNQINRSLKRYLKTLYLPMKTFITDMSTQYRNFMLTELCNLLKVKKLSSTAHHHQTLGTIERTHRIFNEYVRSYISVDKHLYQ